MTACGFDFAEAGRLGMISRRLFTLFSPNGSFIVCQPRRHSHSFESAAAFGRASHFQRGCCMLINISPFRPASRALLRYLIFRTRQRSAPRMYYLPFDGFKPLNIAG